LAPIQTPGPEDNATQLGDVEWDAEWDAEWELPAFEEAFLDDKSAEQADASSGYGQ